MKFSTKSLFLALVATSLTAFTSCQNHKIVEPEPQKGDFEVVLTNSDMSASTSSRAFWGDTDAAASGEECEKKITSVSIFAYNAQSPNDGSIAANDVNTCIYRRDFTLSEINTANGAAPTAVFSLPEEFKNGTQFDFYAIVNYNVPQATSINDNTRQLIESLMVKDLQTYLKPSLNNPDKGTPALHTLFSDFYPGGPNENAISFRRSETSPFDHNTGVNTGDHFVMAGVMKNVTKKAAGDNEPTKIEIPVQRLAAKMQVKISIGAQFVENYHDVLGNATIEVDSVAIKNVMTNSYIIPTTNCAAPLMSQNYNTWGGFNVINIHQKPNIDKKESTNKEDWMYYSNFYLFENVASTATAAAVPSTELQPVLYIRAKFDVDGNSATTEDQSIVTFETPILVGDQYSPTQPQIRRNHFYRVEVEIQGLSAEQAVARVFIQNWNVVNEKIELGS